jgi:hypothetical protein
MNPELALWRAVVAQAFADATFPGATKHTNPRKHEQDNARVWLLRGRQNLNDVCAG